MIGAGLGLALAVLAQTPPAPRDTQLVVAFSFDQTTPVELLARQALYAQRIFERDAGRRARAAWTHVSGPAPRHLARILEQSGLVLLTEPPFSDSTRLMRVSGPASLPTGAEVDRLLFAEMLAALDTATYSRAPLAAAWLGAPAADTVRGLRDAAFARLTADLDTRGGGVAVAVFNPSLQVRSAATAVPRDSALRVQTRGTGELRAVDAARRATAVTRDGDSLRFVAREVPPVGLKVFWIRDGRAPAGAADSGAAPLHARAVRTRAGLAGHAWSFVAVDEPRIVVTALKPADQARARVLRLAETGGKSATVRLTFGPRLARVRVANLLEDPLHTLPLTADGRGVVLTLRPWDFVTLLIEEAR